ncbi:MAG: RagB/SusD family nutrient uptake outer membrane protein [Gemmatimonadota bacterium]
MNEMTKRAWGIRSVVAFTLLALPLTACSFDVVNPGVITEDALESPEAIAMITNGFIADVEAAFEDLVLHTALASDELTFSGTRSWLFYMGNGDMRTTDGEYTYDDAAKAVWTTVMGIERLTGLEASPAQIAVANLYAGYMHRIMGETFCGYVFDGGELKAREEWFNKALAYFQAAAGAGGDVGTAAKAGQAQTLVLLGRVSEAAAIAATIPDGFVWYAHYTDQDTSLVWEETHNQTQASVWGTAIAALPAPDPRAVWVDEGRFGAGGSVDYYRQDKYINRTDDHPLARGWEMRLIEAEALLASGNRPGAMTKINYVRSAFGMPAAAAVTDAEAWTVLKRERLVTLWLEGRRLADLYRLNDPFLAGRDYCFPFSKGEINSNLNLAGCTGPACS